MHVFLDWCSVAQEAIGTPLFGEYMASLPAFVAQVSYILVPLDSRLLLDDKYRLDDDFNPVPMNWAFYNVRGWCPSLPCPPPLYTVTPLPVQS